MKIFIISLAITLLSAACFAQSAQYDDVSEYAFNGLKTEDGKLFYIAYYGPPASGMNYNYVIQIFNSDLKRVVNDIVPVKWANKMLDVAEHNGGLVFFLQRGKNGAVLHYDKTGKKVWEKELELEKGKFDDVNVRSLGDQGMIIVHSDKEKKSGYRISLFDNTLNQKWSQTFAPDKGSIDHSKVQVNGDKVAVIARFKPSAFSTSFEERAYVFNATDGKLLYEKVITSNVENGGPEDIKLNSDGSLFVIGYLFDPNKSFEETATHMFYTALDATGKELYREKYSLKDDLAKTLLTERAKRHFRFVESPLVNFQHIQKTSNGYQIIGESYKYISQPNPTGTTSITSPGKLYVMDYVIMDIANNGKLTIKRVDKPYKQINGEGHMVSREAHADEYFEKYGLFSYRYLNEKEGKPEIVSLNWGNNSPYIGYTSVDVDHENILNRIHLNKSISEIESGEVTSFNFVRAGLEEPVETFKYNILPYHASGKYLYYDLERGKLSMEVKDLKVEMPKPANKEVALQGIPARDFQGLMPLDGKGYYTFYFSEVGEDNKKLYIYHRLDNQLNTLGRSAIVVPGTAQFSGSVSSGSGQVVVFQDRQVNTWYFYALDDKGNLTGQNSISLAADAKQVPSGNLLLQEAADGFYMLQPYRDTSLHLNGYEVIRLNPNRQVRWTWSHYAEKDEYLQLTATDAGHGLFAVLHSQRPIKSNNKFLNKVMVVDDKTGKLVYDHDLFDGENSGYPEFVKVIDNKNVVTSGMYFKGIKFDQVNSDGLFFLKLTGDGTKSFYTTTSWKQIEDELKAQSQAGFLVSGNTKVLIEDIVPMPDGSFKVVGELYKKSVGTTGLGYLLGDDLKDRAFSIFDFVVFDYNKNGELSTVYRIPKEEQSIELPGSVGYQKGLSLSMMMRRYGMFSYMKTMTDQSKPYLVFTNTVNGEKKVYKAPVAKGTSTVYPSATADYFLPKSIDEMNKLEMLNSKLEKFGSKLDKALTGTDQVFTTFRDPYKGYVVADPNEVLVYYYDPETRQLMLRLRDLK